MIVEELYILRTFLATNIHSMGVRQSTSTSSYLQHDVYCEGQLTNMQNQVNASMGTPKQQVSWLERFPPDIWAYFACYLSGEQLGRLTMTGATQLRQRLKSPNVVKSIKLGKDYIIFKSFPAFLNDFRSLEELSIFSCRVDWSLKLGLKVDLIPPGVRNLELVGIWRNSVAKLFGEPGGTFNLAIHLPHLETLNLYCLDIPDYSWMAHSPQTLTNLSLYRFSGTVALPPSLIHFKVHTVALSASTFVSNLPPQLESFVVTYQAAGADLIVPLLPTSTRKLSFGTRTRIPAGHATPRTFFEQLPNSLTDFQVPHCPGVNFGANPELISLLPSTMRILQIQPEFPCPAWSCLPPQLTQLTFQCPKYLTAADSKTTEERGDEKIPSIPFETLPRSLTSLELFTSCKDYFSGPQPKCEQSYFPPYLTYLNIPDIQLSSETAKVLPACLTFLKIGNFCDRICEHLPKGLKTLRASSTLMSPNLIKFLPNSLTDLHLSFYPSYGDWFSDYNGCTIGDISTHLEYSVHEKCISKSFDWKDTSPLPSTLMDLQLTHCDEFGDAFMLHQHLPTLLELNLDSAKHFTDLVVPLLSPHLTSLSLRSSSQISGKSFKFLPRQLSFLNLNSSESIFDADIPHLPRTLVFLHLNRAIHLTDMCVPDLPPHLEKLNLYNSQITPSSFPHFPYSLRSAQRSSSVVFAKWEIDAGKVVLK